MKLIYTNYKEVDPNFVPPSYSGEDVVVASFRSNRKAQINRTKALDEEDTNPYEVGPKIVEVWVMYPKNMTKPDEMARAVLALVIRLLNTEGVKNIKHSLFYTLGGVHKRFCHLMDYDMGDYRCLKAFIYFEFGGIGRIPDCSTYWGDIPIIGGLWEIRPEFEIDSFIDELIRSVANRFSLELV